MSEQDGAEKTEQATPQKRERARKQGDIARSNEVGVAASMFVLLGTIVWMGTPSFIAQLSNSFAAGFDLSQGVKLTKQGAVAAVVELLRQLFLLISPALFSALIVGLIVNIAQVGLRIESELLAFKPERLDPRNWLKKLVSIETPVAVLKSLFKGLGVVSIALYALRDQPTFLWRLAFGEAGHMARAMQTQAFTVVLRVAAALGVLAIFDLAWTRYRYEEKLKMSKQEIKDEMKQSEGDPHVKAAMRRRSRERKPLAEQVKDATVIATNPTHYAIAIRYWQSEDSSPRVLAKGVDYKAAKIREIAKKHNIPIIEDRPLARALYAVVKEGDTVPVELFSGVARLLAIVYRQRGLPEKAGESER